MPSRSSLLLGFCLALQLILILVHGYPFPAEDTLPEDEEEIADLGDGHEEGNLWETEEDEMPNAVDKLLEMYDRDRRGARWNKNFIGISSLDRSITAYTSFLPCRVEGVCKKKFKQTFNCKCNKFTYCVGPGRKYEARCKYSAVGRVFYQP